jgi:adenine C2-methylase RlmN of 23S rRNA A2503 and tRNA A37|eukprot:COSAG03_NODE_261_length_9786_cov_6.012078_7_plen_570_part_00
MPLSVDGGSVVAVAATAVAALCAARCSRQEQQPEIAPEPEPELLVTTERPRQTGRQRQRDSVRAPAPAPAPEAATKAAPAESQGRTLAARKRVLCPLPIFDEPSLAQAFEKHGVKRVHVKKVWQHLLSSPDATLRGVPGLPLRALQLLGGTELVAGEFTELTSIVKQKQVAKDGTIKLLVQLQDGLEVEAVVMTYDPTTRALSKQEAAAAGRKGLPTVKRATLCVSSQVGCKMGCRFCATGLMGELGQLAAGEILEQLIHARRASPVPISNVVFMGMGEPLNNYDAVVTACRAMVDPQLFGLAPGKVTVSTVGIIPRLHTLDFDLPGVNLALSLHAPNQELRHSIMPSARPFPLHALMEAVDGYCTRSGQRVFVQYIMLGGVNDDIAHAEQLGRLLEGRAVATVNLIPYNPTGVGVAFSTSAESTVTEFQMTLRKKFRINTTVRQQMGQDIDGACGQLVIAAGSGGAKATGCDSGASSAAGVHDIEDIGGGLLCQPQSASVDPARTQSISSPTDASGTNAASLPLSGGAAASNETSPDDDVLIVKMAEFLSRGTPRACTDLINATLVPA